MAVQITEFGLGHAPALTLDLNPLLPTVPHAPKTLPDPPPKKSHLPVPIVEPLVVARNSSTSGTPPALKSPLDETPDDYRPGVASIPLSIDLHAYSAYLQPGRWELDIGVINVQRQALLRLATQGPPEGIEWWYPMSRIRLHT